MISSPEVLPFPRQKETHWAILIVLLLGESDWSTAHGAGTILLQRTTDQDAIGRSSGQPFEL
jgi:hypothetical protein